MERKLLDEKLRLFHMIRQYGEIEAEREVRRKMFDKYNECIYRLKKGWQLREETLDVSCIPVEDDVDPLTHDYGSDDDWMNNDRDSSSNFDGGQFSKVRIKKENDKNDKQMGAVDDKKSLVRKILHFKLLTSFRIF